MDTFSTSQLQQICDDLAGPGWSLQPMALSVDFARELAAECRRRAQQGVLKTAGVGRAAGAQVQEGIRGDAIQWLEPGQAPVSDRYLALMDTLRGELNRQLYLGLEDFECHFALYEPGAFYQKHVDRFRDDDRRAVSAVLYLNEEWLAEQGGALRLYPEGAEPRDVLPQLGTLAVFLSANLPHEVLPATRERLSLTGWFRRRGQAPF